MSVLKKIMSRIKNISTNSEKNCIFFSISSDYIFAAANVILGVERFSPGLISKYVIFEDSTDPVDDASKAICKKLFSTKVEFRSYKDPDIGKGKLYKIYSRFSKLNFCKFKIFDLLSEFDNVLYLDSDVLIQGDVSVLFKKYKPLAWRPTVVPMCQKLNENCLKRWGVTDIDSAPNAGVIFASRELGNYQNLTSDCYRILEELVELTDRISLDELTFGLLAHEYQINVKTLPGKFNSGTGWKNSESAIIVHSIGKYKFWNDLLRNRLFPKWEENNKIWLAAGGGKYQGDIRFKEFGVSNQDILTSVDNLLFWKEILKQGDTPAGLVASKCLTKKYYQFFFSGYSKDIHIECSPRKDKLIVACHLEGKFAKNEFLIKKLKDALGKKYLCLTTKYGLAFQIVDSIDKEELFHVVQNISNDVIGNLRS